MAQSYDVIVVGGGSAGSAIAGRLSEDPSTRVLVLEAGRWDYKWDVFVHMPAALFFAIGNKHYDWMYETEPEPFMDGRRVYHARGKILGGSSSINGMIVQRGNPLDYQRWAKDPGMESWDYAHCLPYFKRLEHALGAMPMEEVWRAKDELDRANDPTPPDPEIHEFLHQRFVANDPQALGSKAAILREEPDRSTRLGEVVKDRGIPVLVLYGEDDDAWPVADQQAMATTIGASVTVIARAGHSPAVDDPAATSAALVDFWSSSAEPSPHDAVWEVSTSTRMGISKA